MNLKFWLIWLTALWAIHSTCWANSDSLKLAYFQPLNSDKKYETLELLASKLVFENADSGRKYALLFLQEAEKRNDMRAQAYGHDIIGRSHAWQARYDQALVLYQKSLELYRQINHIEGVASCLINIGGVYYDKADYPKTIDYWQQALKEIEKTGDRKRLTSINTNLGVVYQAINEYDKAMQYFRKSLAIGIEFNNKTGIGFSYSNIGETYLRTNNLDSAFWYSFKSLEIFEETNHIRGIGLQHNTLGKIYLQKGQHDLAEQSFLKTIDLLEEFGAILGLSEANIGLGSVMLTRESWQEAAKHCEQGHSLSIEGEARELTIKACECLYEAYENLGDYFRAYAYLKERSKIQDSIFNQANATEIARLEVSYQIDKEKEIAALQLAQQDELSKTEIQNQKKLTFGVLAGLSVVFMLLVLIWLNYKRKNRLAIALSEQKKQLEERNRDVTDSIQYAKRIQKAILPSNAKIKELIPDSFILYMPKDIVAGDFYWMETFGVDSTQQTILFAAADCTGHGVPGAMVSVICNNGLNRAVREHGLKDPAEILNKAREIVIEEFAKSEEDVNDGMDISLVALNFNLENGVGASHEMPLQTVSNYKFQWAGANNPLWIVRSKAPLAASPDSDPESPASGRELGGVSELVELKPDKQPIGKYSNAKPFTTHKFELVKGDTLYLLTDGFQDQFGGFKTVHQKPAGKKLKAARLQKLLLSIQHETMSEQRETLYKFFENWRGELEQVDDVCIIGIRI